MAYDNKTHETIGSDILAVLGVLKSAEVILGPVWVQRLRALKPDACCYNPLWPNIDELARLVESGVNVCSSTAG